MVIQSQIPSELGQLKILGVLELRNNRLTGSIPPTLGNPSGSVMRYLILSNNSLSGSIPSECFALSNAHVLWLQNNHFTGEIPSEVGYLTKLLQFFVHGNQLSGHIPSEIGLWGANTTDIKYDKLVAGNFGRFTVHSVLYVTVEEAG